MANSIYPYQLFFEGILPDQPPVNVEDLKRRNAFSRVPKPEYFHIDPSVFEVVTEDDLDRVHPTNIERGLYDRASRLAIDGVVVTPEEYLAIPRNIFAVGRVASAQVVRSRGLLEEGVHDAANRAKVHAPESYEEVLKNLELSYSSTIGTLK